MSADLHHTPTFRLNTALFLGFLALALILWQDMPERYPVHFDLRGHPTSWASGGPGMWILLVSLASVSFGKLHLFQRFLVSDPDSALLNLPWKERFHKLPRERKLPVIRRVNRMLGLMNTTMLLLYITLLLLIHSAAHDPASPSASLANRAALTLILAMLVFPLSEYFAMRRMIRRKLEEEGLWMPGRD